MPLRRLFCAAWWALLPLAAWPQAGRTPTACPPRPAECLPTTPVYNFGRHPMSAIAPPIHAENTIGLTCTRSAAAQGLTVDVEYELLGLPAEPDRDMRHREPGSLRYDLYVDAGRKQFWGDGQGGTKTIRDRLELNDNNRAVTRTHQVYGTVHGQQEVESGQWLGFVSVRLEYSIRKCR